MLKNFFTILLALSFTLGVQAKKSRKYSLGGKKQPNLNTTAHALILLSNEEEGESFCSGPLISPTHVLTAGHCILSPEGEYEYDVSEYTVQINGNTYNVVAKAANSNYDPDAEINEESSQYDIGILTLEEAVADVEPLVIGTEAAVEVGDKAYFYGYGTNKKAQKKANAQAINRGARGKIKITEVTTGVFNAIRKKKKRFATSCPGDSGGAVMNGLGEDAVIIGTVSAGSTGQKKNGACKSTKRRDDDTFVDLRSETSQEFIDSIIVE